MFSLSPLSPFPLLFSSATKISPSTQRPNSKPKTRSPSSLFAKTLLPGATATLSSPASASSLEGRASGGRWEESSHGGHGGGLMELARFCGTIVDGGGTARHNVVAMDSYMILENAMVAVTRWRRRRVVACGGPIKVEVDNTCLLEATDKYIQLQPKVELHIQLILKFVVWLSLTASPTENPKRSMLGRDLEALIQRARDHKKKFGDIMDELEKLEEECRLEDGSYHFGSVHA
ncbi:hypothetical protein LR48_Vigan06g129200 [Vigna angularis]|uniref:Uncharacterized protein n=1 Tax=Phaseolus angularis TaxID=3914 RepID=A0A0L9UTF1_PHAAN|nr:hypothetical protein LR48_Vigan06g129200 [Vigna angularis]